MQPEPLQEVDAWLKHFRGFWAPKLEAMALEVGPRQEAASRVGGARG